MRLVQLRGEDEVKKSHRNGECTLDSAIEKLS